MVSKLNDAPFDLTELRATLDSLATGFQVISPDWVYLYVNPAAAMHGRRRPSELIGRRMADVYPGIEQTPMFESLRQCLRDGSTAAMENQFVFPDGSARWFEIRVQLVPQGLCIESIDIQDRKDVEHALEQINESLEAMVASRTRELETLNGELEAFAYSVSHDLRAPVRHVSGFAGLLQQRVASGGDAETVRLADRINDAAGRMDRLINDLLSFSRTTRAELVRRTVKLDEVVRDAVREVMHDANGRSIEWMLPPLPVVDADASLMRVVFVNLLSNAVKYTRGRAPARIEVGAEPAGDAGVVSVYVRDNGTGFDMQYAGKLFGVFQRLHRQEDFEGTGVGLATVRRIVHRHGGRTWATAAVNEGATFYVSLPEARRAAADSSA